MLKCYTNNNALEVVSAYGKRETKPKIIDWKNVPLTILANYIPARQVVGLDPALIFLTRGCELLDVLVPKPAGIPVVSVSIEKKKPELTHGYYTEKHG